MLNKTLNCFKNPPHQRGIFYFQTFLIAFLLGGSFIGASQPQLKFADSKKNFGFVKKGEVVTIEFDLTNTGNQPLIISDAKFECSCTSVDYPKQPIAPGSNNKVTVKFDTKSVYDRQDRTVEIISNAANSPNKIRFKGVVLNK